MLRLLLACAGIRAPMTTMAKSCASQEYMPQRDAASFYTERFAAYCNLYPTLRDFTRRQTLNQKSNRPTAKMKHTRKPKQSFGLTLSKEPLLTLPSSAPCTSHQFYERITTRFDMHYGLSSA